MLNVKDLKVLSILNFLSGNPYKATTIKDLSDEYGKNSTKGLCRESIRLSVMKLLDQGLITEGFKRGRTKTYYINDDGVKLLAETLEGE